MRFHIGFSKRISIKKLIELIGFIFIMLLTFFGIYDTTYALTQVPNGSFDVYSYTEYTDSSFITTTQRSGNVVINNPSYGYQISVPYYNYGSTSYGGFISATTSPSSFNSLNATGRTSFKDINATSTDAKSRGSFVSS